MSSPRHLTPPVSMSARLRAGEFMYRALRELLDDDMNRFPEMVTLSWTTTDAKTVVFTYTIPQAPQVVPSTSPPSRTTTPAALAAAAQLDAVPFDALNAFIDGEMAQATAVRSGRHTPPVLAKTPRPVSSKKRAAGQISRDVDDAEGGAATGDETEETE